MARCKRCNSFMIVTSDTGYCRKCNDEVLRQMMDKEARAKSTEQRKPSPQPQRQTEEHRQVEKPKQHCDPMKQQAINEMKKVAVENMFAMPCLYPDPISTMGAMAGRPEDILSEDEIAYLGMSAGTVELQAMNGATIILHNNPEHAEESAAMSDIEAAYVLNSVIKKLGITPGDKVMLIKEGKPPAKAPVKRDMYPHIKELKNLFADFFPRYKTYVVRNDNAWQTVTENAFWANQALEYKRDGQYVEACKLYFPNVLDIAMITSGWAKGIFKTLASSGDFADALNFGLDWFRKVEPGVDPRQDQLCTHYVNLMTFLKNPNENPQLFKQYLQSISGNPSYSIDLYQTDMYSDEVRAHVAQYE